MPASHSRFSEPVDPAAWQRRTFLAFAAFFPCLALLPEQVRAQAAELAFAHVMTRREFDVAVRRARAQKKPVLAYFTADWCPICKSIDSRVFSNPVIKARLSNVAVVRADVTAVNDASRILMESLQVPGPPTMFVIGAKDGREIHETRLVGAVDPNLFLDTINLAGL